MNESSTHWNGKRLFFAGVSQASIEAGDVLLARGARLTLADHRKLTELPSREQEGLKRLVQLGAQLELGGYRQQGFVKSDLVLVGRNVPLNSTPLMEAKRRGIPVSSEIELALRESSARAVLLAPESTGKLALGLAETLQLSGSGCWLHADESRSALAASNLSPHAPFAVISLSTSECALLTQVKPRLIVLGPPQSGAPSQEAAYRHLLELATPETQVVLSLESPLHALLSAQLKCSVLWYSGAPPQNIAGPLADDYRGAFFEPDTGFIRAALGVKREAFPIAMQGEELSQWVALLLAARALGVSRRAAQEMLARLSQPLADESTSALDEWVSSGES